MNSRKKPLVTDAFYLKLLKSIKRSIREIQGPEDKEVKKYYRNYASFLEKCRAVPVEAESLYDNVLGAGILLVGDFHTLWQAQRQFIKILQAFEDRGVKPVVLLEMVEAKQNRILQNYLEGEMNEKEFLGRIEYFSNWGFDFSNYGRILNLVKSKKLTTYGINKEGNLRERDSYMAQEISKRFKERGSEPLMVLVGDLHVAPSHLPKELSKLKMKPVVLYQNSETVTLRKMKENINPYDLFRLNESAFLQNNTPPWIKMQSYLTYLEHGAEALLAMYGYSAEEEDEEEIDFSATVQNYIIALKDIFSLHNKKDDDFQVFTMEDLGFLNSPFFDREPGKSFAKVIKSDRALFMTNENTIYTPFPDVNHAVEEAMHYLMGKDLPTEANEGSFWSRIHYFASSYLASKVINPMRETLRRENLKGTLERALEASSEKERKYLKRQASVCSAVSDFFDRMLGEGMTILEFQEFLRKDKETVYEITRTIGYQIGEALFKDYNEGELSGRDLKHCVFSLKPPVESCMELFERLNNTLS